MQGLGFPCLGCYGCRQLWLFDQVEQNGTAQSKPGKTRQSKTIPNGTLQDREQLNKARQNATKETAKGETEEPKEP